MLNFRHGQLWIMAGSLTVLAACAATKTSDSPPVSSSQTSVSSLPPGMDMARLTSEAKEPEGPGTQLGPYPVVQMIEAPDLPTHTLYYPGDYATAAASEFPVLVWGNGACRNDGKNFSRTLKKVASHGFVVIAVGYFEPAENAERTTGAQMIEAMNWLENSPGLPAGLAQKINPEKIGVMGQSCGGLMTLEASSDPRVDTIGVINSGAFIAGSAPPMSLSTFTKDDLPKVHSPALYINGGTNDVAFENANDDFARLSNVPVFYGVMEGAGHFATHRHRNGGRFAEVITAWLEWQLKGDTKAEDWFVGKDCSLCEDPAWTIQKKNID